jgi:hypothetical protein
MLIPLGFLASAGGGVDTDYELIESYILGSSQASVTFSNLGDYSSTYKHLQVRIVSKTIRSSTSDQLSIRLNADSGSNYARHRLLGEGTVQSDASSSQTSMNDVLVSDGANETSVFGAAVVDILDPYSTSKNTTLRILSGSAGTEGRIMLSSGLWNNTNSLTTVEFFRPTSSLATGSRFSIYGLKG